MSIAERHHRGEVLRGGEVVGAVGAAGRAGHQRERAERAAARSERDAHARLRQLGLAAAGDLEDLRLGARSRLVPGRHPRAGVGCREARRRPVVVEEVDEAPVGQLADGLVGDPAERSLVVRRRGEDLARAREDVELPLAVESFGGGGALGREQALALLPGVAALADVEEVALDVERTAVVVVHRHGLVAHPDHAAVAREHPVVAAKRPCAGGRGGDLGRDALAVVLVHELEEEARLGEPLLGGVAENGRDLGADVKRRLALAERVDVGDRRQVLRQGPVLRLAFALLRLGAGRLTDVARDENGSRRLARGVRDRRDGEGDGEVAAVLVTVRGAGKVEALAELRRGGRAHRLVALGREQGDGLPDGLARLVAVDRLGSRAPAHDRPLEVDADDRLGGRVPDGGQLAGDEAALEPGAPVARGQPAGECAHGQPGRQRDERAELLVGDEEEVQRPTDAGDCEAAPDPAERAREGGDQEPGGHGDAGIAVVPGSEQHDERLEDDPEDDRGGAADARRRADGGPLYDGQRGHERVFCLAGSVSFPRE